MELEPFQWLPELSMASKDHCDEIGETMHERVNHYISADDIEVNAILGQLSGLQAIIRMFIDDEDPSRSNRKNMQNDNKPFMGVYHNENEICIHYSG